MANYLSYKELEITAGGGSHNVDLSLPYSVYYIYTSGSVTLTSSWTISDSGTPQKGMEIHIRWRANVDLNGNSVTIFGWTLPSELSDKNFSIILYYNGSSWETDVQMDYEEDGTITNSHLASGSIQGDSINFSQLLGEGITEDPNDVISLHRDTTNGTSLEKSTDGTRLEGDENSPTDLKFYGKTSGSKGWDFLGAGMERYDSGWKQFPDYSTSSTGFVSLSNFPNPQFRIIGRMVFLRGKVIVPLDDGNGNLVSDRNNYPTEQRATVHTASSGISTTDANGVGTLLSFPQLLNDSELFPQKDTAYRRMFEGRRRIQAKGNNNVLAMTFICSKIRFTTSGNLELSSVSNYEIPGSEGDSNTHLKTSQFRRLGTIVNADDYALDYSSYRTAHDGAAFQNDTAQSSEQYPFKVDHTDVNYWGGMNMDIEGLYWIISDSISLETIRSKFANYTDA